MGTNIVLFGVMSSGLMKQYCLAIMIIMFGGKMGRMENDLDIEATSQDISQEVEACSQMGLPNGQ